VLADDRTAPFGAQCSRARVALAFTRNRIGIVNEAPVRDARGVARLRSRHRGVGVAYCPGHPRDDAEARPRRAEPGCATRSISNDSASAAKKPVAWTVRNRRLHPLWQTLPARGLTTPKRSPTRSTSSSTLWQSKSDGDDQRDTQHAPAPAGVTRNSGSPHPVMDGLQPVPSAAPDRAMLTNADQHKASAAEADRGLTRRGGKGGRL
jgi:hypothetical protein